MKNQMDYTSGYQVLIEFKSELDRFHYESLKFDN